MAEPLKPVEKGDNKTVDATEAVAAEGKFNIESNSHAALSKSRPHVTVEQTVLYQLDNYPGFVHAFMSSIRYGPVRYQHDRWRIVGERLTRQNSENGTKKKVLIVLGAHDPIIIQKEVQEDAMGVLQGNVEFAVFEDAGHEVPITKGEEVVKRIIEFWSRTD